VADLPRYRLTRGAFDIVSAFGSLRASVITAVLGLQGYQPSAVRNQITRLVQRGLLQRTKAGAATVYSLAEAIQHRFDMLSADAAAPPYSGRFEGVLFAVPESMRSLRDRIVYVSRFAGYRPLRPGVLIGFEDATETLVAALAPELAVDHASYYDAFFEVSKRVMGFPSLPVELTPGLRSNERIGAVLASLIGLFVERFAAEAVETALAQPSAALIEFLPDAAWAPR
jgi:hypothetical protein